MRLAPPLVAVVFFLVACSQGSPAANVRSTVSPSPSPAAATSAAPSCQPSSAAYGLLIVDRELEVIDTCAHVKTSTQIAPSSVHYCTFNGYLYAHMAPPVSATSSRVYFRDGDTKIKYLTPDGQTGDVTTVPGSDQIVSFFSVSPDDKRIAVLVEDTSFDQKLSLRLYAEDLQGGRNHVDLYSSFVQKDTGNTLWPMGWHDGKLVLAVIQACGTSPNAMSPVEWHVVDPATGNRLVNITSLCDNVNPGVLSPWPSKAGVACMDFVNRIELRDWSDTIFASMSQYFQASSIQTGLSPSGKEYFIANDVASYCAQTTATTCVAEASASGYGWQKPAPSVACLFIDEEHLLTPEGVIELTASTPGFGRLIFTAAGSCAGRFPGGL